MVYPNLTLPTRTDRPFFYANFVQTLDGKVQVTSDPTAYWPLGSEEDFDTLIGLRAYADVLVHGKNTATVVRTVERLGSEDFQSRRKQAGKTKPILYVVVSGHPDDQLAPILTNLPSQVEVLLVTTEHAELPSSLESVPTTRLGKDAVELALLSNHLHTQGMQQVLVEGGPHLFTGFLKDNLLDELFLTVSSKIFGNEPGKTITLSEGHLFKPNQTPRFEIMSCLQHENELYLRYQLSV